jgi:asparagine synthase (glutamine-hydrolysing)
MCGICGVAGFEPVDRNALAHMTAALRHRGPNDEGFHVDERPEGLGVGLGFRRLSVIDLETGAQPITNEDGSVVLVFNGEIYNFRELRRDLEVRGHDFATNADTEVIVHLYEELGSGLLPRLNGMFAFAIWDAKKRELLLARDRFGKKPLYYAELGRTLLFGSELKSLRQHSGCPDGVDVEALSRYLAFEYVPSPWSILSGVRKLPGGHLLRWAEGRAAVERWWHLPFGSEANDTADQDLVEEFRELFRAAVRRRLVSDVPLGAFLSGGIDSSSVVAMMREALPSESVKTFTIGFGERTFDESEHARRVARHLDVDHHEEVFTPGVLLELLPAVADVLDEPFGDASILPTYLLSRFTRQSVTVALGGDGADELLAGYPTFPAETIAQVYRLPRVLHEGVILPLADRLPVSTANFSIDFKLKRFLRGAVAPTAVRHATWLGSFTPAEQAELLRGSPVDAFAEQRLALSNAPTRNSLERLIYLYATTYLQDDILFKVDRASMANSLEVRAPFLDIELVEFLGRIPPRLKLRRLKTKVLLKRAMADVLPPGIANRAKKGFGIPVAAWFKNELRDHLQDELAPARIRSQGLFDPAAVSRLVSEHLSGRRDHRKQLWTLFMFQLWHRRWNEGASARRTAEARRIGVSNPSSRRPV